MKQEGCCSGSPWAPLSKSWARPSPSEPVNWRSPVPSRRRRSTALCWQVREREKEYAKFTLKKGLPTEQRPRTLAVENEPHSVDDFNGVIEEGYGKGEKRLIYSGTGVIKVGGSCQLGKINVHAHEAEKAGFTMTSLPKELTRTRNPSRSTSQMVSSRDAMPSGKPSRRTGIWSSA